MKKFAALAALCMTATFVGCQTTTETSVSPAAVSECGADCPPQCCPKESASYGAVSEKSDACSGKPASDCGACPYSSK